MRRTRRTNCDAQCNKIASLGVTLVSQNCSISIEIEPSISALGCPGMDSSDLRLKRSDRNFKNFDHHDCIYRSGTPPQPTPQFGHFSLSELPTSASTFGFASGFRRMGCRMPVRPFFAGLSYPTGPSSPTCSHCCLGSIPLKLSTDSRGGGRLAHHLLVVTRLPDLAATIRRFNDRFTHQIAEPIAAEDKAQVTIEGGIGQERHADEVASVLDR